MDIKIFKDDWGMLYAMDGYKSSFKFSHRKDENLWYFWMPGHDYDPMIFKGRFPLSYFQDACRAIHFIDHGEGLGDIVIVVKGRNYIGLK